MKLQYIFTALIVGLLLILAGCADTSSENGAPVPDGPPETQVQYLVDNNRFDEALDILGGMNQNDRTTIIMLRDTHLHYGNWLMYHADTIHMTDRMPKALRHFRRVLEIDPDNRQARTNIDQIESIYRQMGRDIPEGVAD